MNKKAVSPIDNNSPSYTVNAFRLSTATKNCILNNQVLAIQVMQLSKIASNDLQLTNVTIKTICDASDHLKLLKKKESWL